MPEELKLQQVKDDLTSFVAAYEKLASRAAPKADGTATSAGNPTLSLRPLSPSALRVGETYDSWFCQVCSGVIPLAPRALDADPIELPDVLIRLTCPVCGAQRDYNTMHGRRILRYPWDDVPSR